MTARSDNKCQVSGIHIFFAQDGIEKEDLEEVCSITIQCSEFRDNYKISFWKIINNLVCAVIIFQKLWRNPELPRIRLRFQDRSIDVTIKPLDRSQINGMKKELQKNSDYIYKREKEKKMKLPMKDQYMNDSMDDKQRVEEFNQTLQNYSFQKGNFYRDFKKNDSSMKKSAERKEFGVKKESDSNQQKKKMSNGHAEENSNRPTGHMTKKNRISADDIPNQKKKILKKSFPKKYSSSDDSNDEIKKKKKLNSTDKEKHTSKRNNEKKEYFQDDELEIEVAYTEEIGNNENHRTGNDSKLSKFGKKFQDDSHYQDDTERFSQNQKQQTNGETRRFVDAWTQYSDSDFFSRKKPMNKNKFKHNEEEDEDDYRNGEEEEEIEDNEQDGEPRNCTQINEMKVTRAEGNEFVEGFDESDKRKFHITEMMMGQVAETLESTSKIQAGEPSMNTTIRSQVLVCLNGQELPLEACNRYIELLQEKYVDNNQVRLLGASLLKSIMNNEDQKALRNLYNERPMTQKYFLFPFFNEYHASLLIYDCADKKGFHVDSFLVGNSHVQILKGYKLNKFFRDFCRVLSNRKVTLSWHYSIWKNLEIIKCPSQLNNNDSNICCLRNIHEFLLQDDIMINLQAAYQITEIKAYRQFISACLLYNDYIGPY